MQIAALGDEARAGGSFRDIVILRRRERLNVLSIRFDRGRFNIRIRIRMVRIDEPGVIEEELVAARRAELAAFLEKDPNFRRDGTSRESVNLRLNRPSAVFLYLTPAAPIRGLHHFARAL